MLKGNTIRSNPGICNQESRPRHAKRADAESFGVYRPVDHESMQRLHDTLVVARDNVNDYLAKRRKVSAPIQIQESMGVTYLQRQRVRRAIRKGRIPGNFALSRMQVGVDTINETVGDDVSVELDFDKFDWYSQHNRKMVGKFAMGNGMGVLSEEAETIGSILNGAEASALRVNTPDHVTFFKYGSEGDRLDLSRMHQRGVLGIVREHFEEACLEELMLGKLIVGKTYTEPVNAAVPLAVAA